MQAYLSAAFSQHPLPIHNRLLPRLGQHSIRAWAMRSPFQELHEADPVLVWREGAQRRVLCPPEQGHPVAVGPPGVHECLCRGDSGDEVVLEAQLIHLLSDRIYSVHVYVFRSACPVCAVQTQICLHAKA